MLMINLTKGTFIYIGLVDILIHEFSNSQDKWLKYILAWVTALIVLLTLKIGFAVITSTIIFFNE